MRAVSLFALILLAACSTPVAVMQHPETKQTVICDQGANGPGSIQASWHYSACVDRAKVAGFVWVGE